MTKKEAVALFARHVKVQEIFSQSLKSLVKNCDIVKQIERWGRKLWRIGIYVESCFSFFLKMEFD